jgi:hypothetical protein
MVLFLYDTRLGSGVGTNLLVVVTLVLGFLLVRFPFIFVRSYLRADFGLDLRPLSSRLREIFWNNFFLFLSGSIFSFLAYSALFLRNPLQWCLIIQACAYLLWGLWQFGRRLKFSFTGLEDYRAPMEAEMPLDIQRLLNYFPGKKVLSENDLLVEKNFQPSFTLPLVKYGKLIIPAKALASLPPKSVKFFIILALAEYQVGLLGKIKLLKLLALIFFAPITLLFLNSLGLSLGYPKNLSMDLLGLIWGAYWMTFWFAELLTLYTRRMLSPYLYAAAVSTTNDLDGLRTGINIMSEKSLEPYEIGSFMEFFRPRPSPKKLLLEVIDRLLSLSNSKNSLKNQKKSFEVSASPDNLSDNTLDNSPDNSPDQTDQDPLSEEDSRKILDSYSAKYKPRKDPKSRI